MSELSLADFMQTGPDGTLEDIAVQYRTSLLEVVKHLPGHTLVSGDHFDAVWQAITGWGKVTFLVNNKDLIMEVSGELPSGKHGHGYYNLHGKSGLSGHIKAEHCRHIALIERKFMKMDTGSAVFFNAEGNAMFKIFLGRDSEHQLLANQVAAFRSLAASLREQACRP